MSDNTVTIALSMPDSVVALYVASGGRPHGRGLYCSQACRQQAYRLRQARTREMRIEAWTQQLERRSAFLLQTVYECPSCEQRFLAIRRCLVVVAVSQPSR